MKLDNGTSKSTSQRPFGFPTSEPVAALVAATCTVTVTATATCLGAARQGGDPAEP